MDTILQQTVKVFIISIVALLFSGCIFQKKICKATVEIPKDVIITEKLLEIKAQNNNDKISTSSAQIPLAAIGIASEYIKLKQSKKDKIIYEIIIYDNNSKTFNINLNMPNVKLTSNIENFEKEKKDE